MFHPWRLVIPAGEGGVACVSQTLKALCNLHLMHSHYTHCNGAWSLKKW